MIDLKNKIIYIHIPKTAGTSVEKYFLNIRGLDFKNRAALGIFLNDRSSDLERANSHSSLQDLETYYFGGPIPDDFRIFTIVRNPFKRFWSEWSYRRIPNPDRVPFSPYLPLNVMIRLTENPKQVLKDFNSHMRPQSSFLEGAAKKRVRVLKFESLAEDFEQMRKDWDLPELELPRENKSKRKRVASEQEQAKGDAFVRKFYATDFSAFGYDLDPPKVS